MVSEIVVGLGLITMVVGSFASEIYLAKKAGVRNTNLNRNHYAPTMRR